MKNNMKLNFRNLSGSRESSEDNIKTNQDLNYSKDPLDVHFIEVESNPSLGNTEQSRRSRLAKMESSNDDIGDFKPKSSASSHHSFQSSESAESSSCESDTHPEDEAMNFMENFYNQNYSHYELLKCKDYSKQKIWNIEYDETHDLVYIFVAKIERDNTKK